MVGPVWRTLVRAIPASANRMIPNGRPSRWTPLLEKGQLRDAVKSGGNQSTHISMIHRRSLPGRALTQRALWQRETVNEAPDLSTLCPQAPSKMERLSACGQRVDKSSEETRILDRSKHISPLVFPPRTPFPALQAIGRESGLLANNRGREVTSASAVFAWIFYVTVSLVKTSYCPFHETSENASQANKHRFP